MPEPIKPSKLVRWDLPFAEARYPSVSLITEEGDSGVVVLVAPEGIDKYPKYLVHVQLVIALLYYEEAFAFDRGYRTLERTEDGLCAYQWMDSPWLQAYRDGKEIFEWESLSHYLLFGGDNIVEIVLSGELTVERIDSKMILETKHEI